MAIQMCWLRELWRAFEDVPIDHDGCLLEDFGSFEQGEHREDVWRWFESQNPNFSVGDAQRGIWPV